MTAEIAAAFSVVGFEDAAGPLSGAPGAAAWAWEGGLKVDVGFVLGLG